jgi:hypothetical protein
MEDILDEVKLLVSRGVKEFQVIAQELTYYGIDLYKSQKLPELIERMAKIPNIGKWSAYKVFILVKNPRGGRNALSLSLLTIQTLQT